MLPRAVRLEQRVPVLLLGNWATDLDGGSSFGYTLLIVVLLANFCAMFLQGLCLKLGIVAERDLAQACRCAGRFTDLQLVDFVCCAYHSHGYLPQTFCLSHSASVTLLYRDAYPMWINYPLWVIAEISIVATDLAEVIGSATALYLLFGLPLWGGVLITAADVLFLLIFGLKNIRFLELVVFLLCALIFGIFVYEVAVVNPDWAEVRKGFIPKPKIITGAHATLHCFPKWMGIGVVTQPFLVSTPAMHYHCYYILKV